LPVAGSIMAFTSSPASSDRRGAFAK
jgi:hypothetical protein